MTELRDEAAVGMTASRCPRTTRSLILPNFRVDSRTVVFFNTIG
ncbi:hypothetical protein ROG8370_03894 [Roseovarius gaetbuli]|uniref:Uncharacterized protein n=1 Tax=Roseovarius gaetbuli TaxID=1356575 RepID=A0A1X7AD74_9RHOB|nr:hypothetical protein ROG8370_03894 [Roseovarius gaetbuli]